MSVFGRAYRFGLAALEGQRAASREPSPDHDRAAAFPDLAQHLSISCPSPTDEDAIRDKHRMRGQFLARQDRWKDLVAEVLEADGSRAMTPAAMPVAELLCFGARSDVIATVEHALSDGAPARGAPLLAGIEALEEMLAEDPQCPIRAVIVAQAHMDIGWCWRGSKAAKEVPQRNMEAFCAHFDRARDILVHMKGDHSTSPLFSTATCTLNASGIAPFARLAQDYERLIDLNPMCPAPMRALGNYLSPRWYGSHAELELEARRTAARTHGEWGAGGYTWVMFDALVGDASAREKVDVAFFVEGVWDILDRMKDQHTANTLAAYCAVTMGPRPKECAAGEENRRIIASLAGGIVRNHLTELHPMIWAHAAAGFDNSLRVSSVRRFAARGRQQALTKIAELFSSEIAQGNRIIFTSDGPVAEH